MGPPHRGYHGRMPKGDDRDIEQRPVHPNIHQSILEATKGKNYVTPVMRDHSEESGEPHIYGTRGGRSPVSFPDRLTVKGRLLRFQGRRQRR